jgi:hypothetical protein
VRFDETRITVRLPAVKPELPVRLHLGAVAGKPPSGVSSRIAKYEPTVL